jgi:hypothetical protein
MSIFDCKHLRISGLYLFMYISNVLPFMMICVLLLDTVRAVL